MSAMKTIVESGDDEVLQSVLNGNRTLHAAVYALRTNGHAEKPSRLTRDQRRARTDSMTLIRGDCRKELRKVATATVDTIITDPPYAEVRPRGAYGRIKEDDWHSLMHDVVTECRRVLKPKGSAVFILQPTAKKMGQMRLWLWEFLVWAGKNWNLVEDVYWWNPSALPTRGVKRQIGLLRPSVKMCIWLGSPDCYRNQDAVLWTPSDSFASKHRAEMARTISPSGHHWRGDTITKSADERGGTTPFNLLPIPTCLARDTRRQRRILWQTGGQDISCRPAARSSTRSSVRERRWRQGWTTGHPRSSASTGKRST